MGQAPRTPAEDERIRKELAELETRRIKKTGEKRDKKKGKRKGKTQ